LTEEAEVINSTAAPPRVVTTSDLAEWASQLPAIIIQFFRPGLGEVVHLHAWGRRFESETPRYVEIEQWQAVKQLIVDHTHLAKPPANVILPLQGESGVGKTRLVYEALCATPGTEGLVLYTVDDRVAESVAYSLANDTSSHAILIVAECSLKSRNRLLTILAGLHQRVRIVTIENSGRFFGADEMDIWLKKLPDESVEVILETNFPTVPAERRRVYVKASHGFVRCAIILCKKDYRIAAKGDLGPALPEITELLSLCLDEDTERLRIVELLSLVPKAGFRDGVANELTELCKLAPGFDRNKTIEIIQRQLKDAPGFVALAGRYYYVTPPIVAQAAFDGAWKRWIAPDPDTFLEKIAPALVKPFIERVGLCGSQEVRRIVGDFFRHWFSTLRPMELTDTGTVDQIEALVETEPETYLPLLRQLIETSAQDQLLTISGESVGRWGPRRSLVWLAERMASFPEYFAHAEAILLKLALAESEPGIANNATGIWQQLFRIHVSGTGTPFMARVQLLRQRLTSSDETEALLGLQAISQVFAPHVSRTLGPAIVAGRVPPRDWQPQTQTEERECVTSTLNLLQEILDGNVTRLQIAALEVIVENLRSLVYTGFLANLKSLLAIRPLPDSLLPRVIEGIEIFLDYDTDEKGIPADYVEEVRDWLRSLTPHDLHGRLVAIAGKDPWHRSFRGGADEWKAEIAQLAHELYDNRKELHSALPWLCSAEARSAGLLGEQIGRIDGPAKHLDLVIAATVKGASTAFVRGYVACLLENQPRHIPLVNEALDRLESQHPRIAYDLFVSIGQPAKALERALRLIDARVLPLEYLRGFLYEAARGDLSDEGLVSILERLTTPIKEGDATTAQVALELIAAQLHGKSGPQSLAHAPSQNRIWEILEATTETGERESFHWGQVVEQVSPLDPDRAARIASQALVGDGFLLRQQAERILTKLVQDHPIAVMRCVGEVMLDEHRGWRFFLNKYADLLRSLPLDTVRSWLQEAGVEGARRLARHLPPPYLGEGERPIVPPLTELMLSTFESDDRTFREFCAGVHSMQLYVGDMAAAHKKEAEVARAFLNHPNRRVREWAVQEVYSAEQQSNAERQREEEYQIE
jgi:hypothetical protein